MPNVEIQDLPIKDPPSLSDKLEIQEDGGGLGSSKYITVQALASLLVATSGVQSVVAGTNVIVDDTDPANPIVSVPNSSFGVLSVNAGTGITVTGTSQAPIVNTTAVLSIVAGDSIAVTGTQAARTVALSNTIKAGHSGLVSISDTATGALQIGSGGSGSLTLGNAKTGTISLGNSSTNTVSIGNSKSSGQIQIGNSATVNLSIRDLLWPTADGTAGQAIVTDGAGTLSFASVATGTVESVNSGTNITVDNSDPDNPIVNTVASPSFDSIAVTNGVTADTISATSSLSSDAGIQTMGPVSGSEGEHIISVVSGADNVLNTFYNETNGGFRSGIGGSGAYFVQQVDTTGTQETTAISIQRDAGVRLYYNDILKTSTEDYGMSVEGQVQDTDKFICRGRVLVRRLTTAQSIPDSTGTVIEWNSITYDDLSSFDGTSTFTVPTGITFFRATLQTIFAANSTGYRHCALSYNGGFARDGLPEIRVQAVAGAATVLNAAGALQTCSAGIDIQAVCTQTSGGDLSLNQGAACFLCIEWY